MKINIKFMIVFLIHAKCDGRPHLCCSNSRLKGGPLFDGEIEDYNGRCHVMCPWHSYMFDLATGRNEIGLQQNVPDIKYEDGLIYIRYHTDLSVLPCRKPSEKGIDTPTALNSARKVSTPAMKGRKESVLESVMKLGAVEDEK